VETRKNSAVAINARYFHNLSCFFFFNLYPSPVSNHKKLERIFDLFFFSIPLPWIGTHTSRIQRAIHFDKIDRLSPISHIGYRKSELEKRVSWFWKVLCRGNYVKLIAYRKKKIMCSRERNGYSIRRTRSNRKKPDLYGISLNPEYGDTPDCTNLHLSLSHQSALVIVIWIPWLDLSDEKCETKEGSSCWELDPTLCPPSSQKMERCIDRFIGS
jgi:hypothetical protein